MRRIKTATIMLLFFLSLSLCLADTADTNDLSAYYGFGRLEIIKLDWRIRSLNIVDLNADKLNDIVIANNTKSSIELLVQKETLSRDKDTDFLEPEDVDINQIETSTRFDKQTIAISQKITSLVCGDLNSDGNADIAFYGSPKGLYIILQKTDKEKSAQLSWATTIKIDIEDGLPIVNAMACADLNNDGADDLVLAGRKNIYIILQKKDGSLAEPVKYPLTQTPKGLRIADLNGDKINDLLVMVNDREKPLHVRFGKKNGQLGPTIQFALDNPWFWELFDIDQTPGDELLVVDSIGKRLTSYRFNDKSSEYTDWPMLTYPLVSNGSADKRDLVIDDFDGDKLIDVIVTEPDSAEFLFYKQIAKSGLAEPVRFGAFTDIQSIASGDIDNDSKAELLILSVKEKVIGISEFEKDRFSFPKALDIVGEPVAMQLADIDSNGKDDCVYISKDVNDIRSLRIIYDLGSVLKKKKTKAKTKDVLILKLEKLSSNPAGIKILDVDQDSLKDLIIFVQYDSPILVRQVEKGKFEIVDSTDAQASLISQAALSSITVADIDNKKGKELIIAQKNFARSLIFAESKTWTVLDQYNAKSSENNISAVAVFDLEGDLFKKQNSILLIDAQKGKLQILKPTKENRYRFENQIDIGKWNPSKHFKFLHAKLTGSAEKSLLLFDGVKFALISPPGDSDSAMFLEKQFSYETKIKDGNYANFTAGDINSDGRADIVMVEYKRNYAEILTLDADDKPVSAMRFKIFERKKYRDGQSQKGSIEPRELKIADVTGDGKNDLVTIIHDRVIIYPQD